MTIQRNMALFYDFEGLKMQNSMTFHFSVTRKNPAYRPLYFVFIEVDIEKWYMLHYSHFFQTKLN